ncbi:hypothetical protein HAX54_041024 [Datura stramonium]|uniref:Uncharacterized protein n=1 Tax=Datura stramonium TaxID=4076 RepID=A0ABS8VQ32_DATST|nr:hypothetical protein [Datura stramonium]
MVGRGATLLIVVRWRRQYGEDDGIREMRRRGKFAGGCAEKMREMREGSDFGGGCGSRRRKDKEGGDGVAAVRRRRQWLLENRASLGDFRVISG